ncbi:TY-Chap domain-containing protein [Paenarthrobacter sp. NCHU4564]|uniref:TY-Chap domain-containing protein n=1 Tax=Paenarthrobacter sp. NCHU4564 TaxID=3451353 RepID=UPI003F996994
MGAKAEASDSAILEAYRRGDPLAVIASAHGLDASGIFDHIAELEDDLARSRAVWQRAALTMRSIRANIDMITRLDDSGIALSDTPKVVGALGNEIDVDVAVAMMHFLGIPEEDRELPGLRLTDKLSLLYVLGKHHGIEPDYQLALATMPLDAIAAFRQFVKPDTSYTRLSEILAVSETTALAIRAKTIKNLSYSEYDEVAGQISRRFGRVSLDESDPWPVPTATLVNRYGRGSWREAMDMVGLKVCSSEDLFSVTEHQDSLDAFIDECEMCGYSMSVETYDLWVYAQAGMRIERPAAVEIVRHFGVSWDELIELCVGSDVTEVQIQPAQSRLLEQARREECELDIDGDRQDGDDDWHRTGNLVSELLARMPWNSFLRVEYDLGDNTPNSPYAQATPSADGVWCEVVSEEYLPAADWPITRQFLSDDGWSEPDTDFPNWWKSQVSPDAAGHQIIAALRHGRQCPDVTKFRWSTGEFPLGNGPDGGVTLDDALNGAVQTLRNAS